LRNRKNGFTLAELLISLTIIGVVVVITIPQLINHIQKEQSGPMLGKIVNQIELGCRNMMQADFDNNVENGEQPAEILSVMTKPKFTATSLAEYVGYDTSEKKFKKFGASYELRNINTMNYEMKATIATITIDVNADNPPNKNGEDKFVFDIRNDGRLIPADEATKKVVANGFRIKD